MSTNRVQPGAYGDAAFAQWRKNPPGLDTQALLLAVYKPDANGTYRKNDLQNIINFAQKRNQAIEEIAYLEDPSTAKVDDLITKDEFIRYLVSQEQRVGKIAQDNGCDPIELAADITNQFFELHDLDNNGVVDVGEMAAKTAAEMNVANCMNDTLLTEEKNGGQKPYTRSMLTILLNEGYPMEILEIVKLSGLELKDDNEDHKKIKSALEKLGKLKDNQQILRLMASDSEFEDGMQALSDIYQDKPELLDNVSYSKFKVAMTDPKINSPFFSGQAFTEVGREIMERAWLKAPMAETNCYDIAKNVIPVMWKNNGLNKVHTTPKEKKKDSTANNTAASPVQSKKIHKKRNNGFNLQQVLGLFLLIMGLGNIFGVLNTKNPLQHA